MPLLGERYVSSKDEGYVRGFVKTFGSSWFVKENKEREKGVFWWVDTKG